MVALCLITGQVLRGDGSAFAGATLTFTNLVTQVAQNVTVPPTVITATTDTNGNINGGSGISLIQGVFLKVAITFNGNMYSQWSALVPNVSATTFANLVSGMGVVPVVSTNVVTGTWTPVPRGSFGTDPNLTGILQDASFAQDGPIVWFSFHLGWTGYVNHGLGNAFVSGLPYTPITPGTSVKFFLQIDNGLTDGPGWTNWCGQLNPGDSNVYFMEFGPFGVFPATNPLTCLSTWRNQPSNLFSYGVFRWQ